MTRRGWVSVLLIAAVLVAVVVFAPQVPLLIFAGVLVAVFLRGGGEGLGRMTGIGGGWGLLVFLLLLAALIALFFTNASQGLFQQFGQLLAQLPSAIDRLEQLVNDNPWMQQVRQRIDLDRLIPSGMGALATVSSTVGVLGNMFLVAFIGIYCAISPAVYRRGVVALIAPEMRPRARAMLTDAGGALRSWLTAQLASMAVIGVLTFIGLSVLGVPLALVLAVMAGIATFVPNIGPVVAAIPAVLLGLSQGLDQVALIVGLYVMVQAIESYLVTPRLQQELVSLPPALTISFQLMLGYLFGLLGFALATPLLAVVMTLANRHYIADYLEGAQPSSTSSSP
ncbi:AI-2E family transporter [Falsirhodobacter sp. 20TX0035]|uniref:AI-2E family transporter n=1 Tax=Falsirhodobacter sp. 20TX0035 TaxID=3022019 RepID=UPI0023314D51|nr:AI-2E family transporter [Falsirhodobacter sp. 20TX0035]MDB6453170.1 AI-2E family transporter [Falsirhodobacter sp. 20TX0035]